METPRSRPNDGTDMPHSTAATPTSTTGRSTPISSSATRVKGDGAVDEIKEQKQKQEGAERFLTYRAKHSEADGIRGLMPLEKPGIVSFLAGRPNPDTYPFESMTLTLRTPLEERIAESSSEADSAPAPEPVQVIIEGEDLDVALQYGPSAGLVKLRNELEDMQAVIHKREKGDWAVSLGSGSQDLMYKIFQAILDEGDPVLCETPLYAGALPALRARNAECIEVEIDDGGLSPANLERILREWPADKKRPRCVYTNPIGCNPSGCSASRERKLEILEICIKYDILIIEDDPYYFLTPTLIPSYFELEPLLLPTGQTPSLVIRFDSFSKLFSGGMRLGYATGPTRLVHSLDVITSATNLHTSSISQIVAFKLLKSWGLEGFMSHSRAVAQFYAERREWFEEMAHRYLDGLASWVSPVAGMFLWIDCKESGIYDTERLIKVEALEKGVLAVPGYAFYPSGRKSFHLRVSFSIIDKESAELGLSRLAEAIKAKKAELELEAKTNGKINGHANGAIDHA